MIKVIFLKDIGKIRTGEVKEVSDGYALNYLLPHGLAEVVTEAKLKQLEQNKIRLEQANRQAESRQVGWLKLIQGQTINVPAKATTSGRLYASITPEQIVRALNNKLGLAITVQQIALSKPVKTIGTHAIEVVFGQKQRASFTLTVEPLAT